MACLHFRPCQRPRAWLPTKKWRAASVCCLWVSLLLGMPLPSAVRTACFVQRGIMSQHNLPPAEKRHVLPLGEKESILLSSINLELAIFFSLYHFRLPTTISLCALLHLQEPCHPACTSLSRVAMKDQCASRMGRSLLPS